MPEVRIEEVSRFMRECLQSKGVPEQEAREHSALLLYADLTGHYSHGLNRLDFYIRDLESGRTNPNGKPVILKENACTAWVDGGDALGATVGNFSMDLAIRKAKEAGLGWVATKGSTHFGMAGWRAQRAQMKGLIGMAFTNSSPLMVPTRAKDGALGTNPIAMAASASSGDSILVDMSTTAVALGKVEVKIHEEKPLPDGWAMDPDGKMTHDPKVGFDSGRLYPLGGVEETGGYKGYCLGAMNEVFCSSLSESSDMGRSKEPEIPTSNPVEAKQYRDESSGHLKNGYYQRALTSLNKAIELAPEEKAAYVARSKCHLLLGEPHAALADAETALTLDPKHGKALLHKAEALYYCGEFEMSLVHYHRGLRARPDLNEFRLGVQKAQEAIENTIGAVKPAKKPTKRTRSKSARPVLGQLMSDKLYLENLLKNPDLAIADRKNNIVTKQAEEALRFLENREEFWRQQQTL